MRTGVDELRRSRREGQAANARSMLKQARRPRGQMPLSPRMAA
jgi:hypothetical protein